MGQSANPHDRHGRNIDTSGTSVEARTESPYCFGTYELYQCNLDTMVTEYMPMLVTAVEQNKRSRQ